MSQAGKANRIRLPEPAVDATSSTLISEEAVFAEDLARLDREEPDWDDAARLAEAESMLEAGMPFDDVAEIYGATIAAQAKVKVQGEMKAAQVPPHRVFAAGAVTKRPLIERVKPRGRTPKGSKEDAGFAALHEIDRMIEHGNLEGAAHALEASRARLANARRSLEGAAFLRCKARLSRARGNRDEELRLLMEAREVDRELGVSRGGPALYVGNLSFHTEAERVREVFAQVGEVVEVKVMFDRETGRSRGFGFVTMASEEEAEAAVAQMNGTMLDGRDLLVSEDAEHRTGQDTEGPSEAS